MHQTIPEAVGESPPLRPPHEYWTLLSDLDDRQIVSIHVKRTYRLLADGRCEPAPQQMPLMMAPLVDGEGNQVFFEGDVMPVKAGADLIVMGTAYGSGARELTASIAVADHRFVYRVFGSRRCSYHGPGTLRFTAPELIDEIPLRYEFAYGGVDSMVQAQRAIEDLVEALLHQPGAYPRNPVGKGYAVFETRERLDGLELPNIEHPDMLLTPGNLILGAPQHWWRAPLPWSCDWFNRAWYPRCTFQGVLPEYLPEDDRQMYEVRAGWVEPGQATRVGRDGPEWDYRVFSAASPALVLPILRGDERIELTAIGKNPRMVVALPGGMPALHVRYRGRQHEVQPLVQRVLISTDEMGVSILWHGAWPTPFELPEIQPRPGDDLYAMVGVEVSVDGRRITTAL